MKDFKSKHINRCEFLIKTLPYNDNIKLTYALYTANVLDNFNLGQQLAQNIVNKNNSFNNVYFLYLILEKHYRNEINRIDLINNILENYGYTEEDFINKFIDSLEKFNIYNDKIFDFIENVCLSYPNKYSFYYLFNKICDNIKDKNAAEQKLLKLKEKYINHNRIMAYYYSYIRYRKFKNLCKKISSSESFYYTYYSNNNIEIIDQKKDFIYTGSQDLNNKTLLLVQQLGFGDNILTARFLNDLFAKAGKIKYYCNSSLIRLFKYNFNSIEFIETEDYSFSDNMKKNIINMSFDYYLPIFSLPYIYKGNYFNSKKYLNVDINDVEKFKENNIQKNKFNIGISYKGNSYYTEERIIELKHFSAISKIKNVQLYSLQYNENDENLKNKKIINLGKNFKDFYDTAVAIEAMDLVISVDCAVLNLAGALGKKTFGLFPDSIDPRWPKQEAETSGWYDSVKPFYNDENNNWAKTMKKVEKEVKKMIKSKYERF